MINILIFLIQGVRLTPATIPSLPSLANVMASEDLIDDRIPVSQIIKAVDALHAYESKKQQEREETELLPGKEPNIWLNVTVKQVAPKNKIKPVKMHVFCLIEIDMSKI